jgi:branched-subunit amino acid aminotransferase/4-amino-4-deoxychorismate lyase
MTQSASELGLALDPAELPDASGVARLIQANGGRDAVVRITLSGGGAGGGNGIVWMRLAALPRPIDPTGAVVEFSRCTLAADDLLARHKTLNYWSRRLAYEQGRELGADEVLLATPDGRFWEGSRTSLFLVRDRILTTPGLAGPVLPGIMRGLVLELAMSAGLTPAPCDSGISRAELETADEIFLTNAVRGLVPVGRTPDRTVAAPGPGTCRLSERVVRWLQQEGRHA